MAHTLLSVSYTHLDVYKRQVMARTYAVMPYGSAKDLADKMRANGIYIGAEPGNRILLNPLMVTPAQVKTVCETLTTCMQQIKEEL